jgi:hypothetical protein
MEQNGVNITLNGMPRCIKKLLKICVILLSSIRGKMGICFNSYIYKVVFNLYLSKLNTYLTNINELLINW